MSDEEFKKRLGFRKLNDYLDDEDEEDIDESEPMLKSGSLGDIPDYVNWNEEGAV